MNAIHTIPETVTETGNLEAEMRVQNDVHIKMNDKATNSTNIVLRQNE